MKLFGKLRLNPLFLYSGLPPISVSFQYVNSNDSLESFWDTFSFRSPRLNKISGPRNFLQQFYLQTGEPASVVLIIDEFSSLHSAQPNVRDSFLNVFREIRNADGVYAIRSIIAAGLYSMTYLRTSNGTVAPFNSGIHIRNPNFTLEGVGQLFREFATDRRIQIDDDIIEDVFKKTNGYVSRFD